MKYLFLGFLFIFLLSCKQDKTVELHEFPVKQELDGVKVQKDYFTQTSQVVTLNDSLAIYFSYYAKENIFNFVELDNFRRIFSFGVSGNGPGEFLNPGKIFVEQNKKAFWVKDGMQQLIFRYPLDSILNDSLFVPNEIINIQEHGIVSEIEIRDGQLYLYTGQTGEHVFYKLENGEKLGIGKSHIYIPDNFIQNLNLSSEIIRKHPQKPLYAIAYISDDILLIMDENGKIIRRIKGPDFIDPMESLTSKQIPKTAYQEICVDEHYIYGLYNGGAPGYLDEHREFVYSDPMRIFVFNWDGEPIKELVLEYPTYSFDLDKNRNRIITYSNALDEEIVYYDYEF